LRLNDVSTLEGYRRVKLSDVCLKATRLRRAAGGRRATFCVKNRPLRDVSATDRLRRPAARQPAGGQAAAEGRRRADQGGVRLLEPQEEKQQGRLPHHQRQAREERRLQHQRPLRGLPPADGEDADQEGESQHAQRENCPFILKSGAVIFIYIYIFSVFGQYLNYLIYVFICMRVTRISQKVLH